MIRSIITTNNFSTESQANHIIELSSLVSLQPNRVHPIENYENTNSKLKTNTMAMFGIIWSAIRFQLE